MDGKVAIVGIGCRYPGGVNTPGDFWTMLAEGRDCTIPPPDDRFDTSYFWHPNRTPGKLYNRCGGYLQCNVFEFDRQFFKIPPDEANHLDPQIQLLLEVTWEALENAGIPPRSLRGSDTGVYVGVTSSEYLMMTVNPFSNISQYTNSGTNSCMVANRISYEFDLHGPSFSVDTACSSSLYSIHLASEAIRKGDCSMAIAGGVNLMLLPGTTVGFCQAGMLSPDGKCKSFDASADGYCRSEGAGVVVLKPLSRALADGDRIYSVIRGGTLTNDGRTPGIANPSYDAQLDLVEKACAAAKVHPHGIQYVEAHGTGTKVGDRTEANALGQILGRGRSKEDPPLYIGSVKSNFGHTEGAAGVAGIIKLALMISKAQIPRVVHFSSPNPDIHFDMLNIKVPSSLVQWEGVGTRLAGCSSFGFGGANAHLILEASPSREQHPAIADCDRPIHSGKEGTRHDSNTIMVLSGNTKAALKEQIEHWISFIADTIAFNEDRFSQSLYTAANRYQHHAERLAIVVNGPRDAVEKLNLLKKEEKLKTAVDGKVPDGAERGKMAFVFSGMGTQWWGMARKLALENPVFIDVIRRFEDVLKTLGADWSIADMLTKETDPEKINRTDIAQPCICAVQIGLVELLKQYDVIPDAIIGHSVGEVAAAYAAGLLSFENAVRVIYHRGKELSKTSGHGKMLAVLHPIQEVEELLEKEENKNIINVAATNSPNQIVLSGDVSAVDSFHNKLKSNDIKGVLLKVNNAFHSYQQEQVRNDILTKLSVLSASTRTTEAQIPMISTVTNKWLSPEITNTAHYWWTNIRQQVRFMQSAQVLLQDGYSTFVEIGAHPALSPALRDVISTINSRNTKQNIIPTLLRPRDTSSAANDYEHILVTTGTLHVKGYPVNFRPAFEGKHRLVHDIPAYPWQRVLCNAGTEASSTRYKFPPSLHPLLGQVQETSEGRNNQKSKVWCSNLSEESVPWLKHHILDGNVVVPAAAYMETALAAASEIYEDQYPLMLTNLHFKRFMFAPTSEAVIKSTLQHSSASEKQFGLYSKDASGSWVLHATAEVHKRDMKQSTDSTNLLTSVAEKCSKTISNEEIYEAAKEAGFHLGSSFHCVTSCAASESYEEALVTAEAPEEISREFGRYIYHPAFMDTFLHTFACLSLLNDKHTGKTPSKRVPFSMKSLCMFDKMPSKASLYFRISRKGERRVVDITVTDVSGHHVICEVEELMFEDIEAGSSSGIRLWNLQWEPLVQEEHTEEQAPKYKHVLILHENEGFGSRVSSALQDKLGCAVDSMNHKVQTEGEGSKGVLTDMMQECNDLDHIIVLCDSDKQEQIEGPENRQAQILKSFKCLSTFKHFSQGDNPPTLWIFTRGSSSVQEQDIVSPFLASASSLCLSISQEYPQFKVKAVDLTPHESFSDAAAEILTVLQANPRENEIAARSDSSSGHQHVQLYARRLSSMKPDQILTTCSPEEVWAFDPKQRQNGNKLCKAQTSLKTPTQIEATVKLEAFAVSPFADLLERHDDMTKDIHIICGTAHHIPKAMMIDEGSRVMGVVMGCITPQMNMQMKQLVPVPSSLSWDNAVAIVKDLLPAFVFFQKVQTVCEGDKVVVFLTDENDKEAMAYASLALHQKAQVRVVAGAVGNVGNTIKSCSPMLPTTVTTFDKIDEDIPDQHASVVFLPKGDRAGDVALQAARKLQAYGTLVNLGSSTILMDQLPKNIKYITVDPLNICYGESSLFAIATDMQHLLSKFDQSQGTLYSLTPSVQTTTELSSLSHTLHQQQKALKIPDIVTIDAGEVQLGLDIKQNQFHVVNNATYVVTGGLKGFGLALLEWLVKSGAHHLVVLARSEPNDEAKLKLEAFSAKSVDVKVMKVDVTDRKAVEEALVLVWDTMPPIEGIFHCAAVYADKLIDQTTQDDWKSVMLPKAVGAVILHDETKKLQLKLKYFVLISSVVALFGNTGQVGYCAANSTLIALGEARRQEGLPATVASFGVINTVGFAERSGLVKMWEKMGVQSISPQDALEILGCMMENGYPHFGITATFDIRKYCSTHKSMVLQHLQAPDTSFSRFTTLVPSDVLSGSVSLSDKILAQSKENGLSIIQGELIAYICQQLGIEDPAEITEEISPVSLGLDSLLSVDMSNEIADKFEVTVTSVELLSDKMTVKILSESIYEKMLNKAGNQGTTSGSLNPEAAAEVDSWLHFFGNLQDPTLSLVCFPANGGGPSLFHQWGEHFAKHNIEVVVATLPGWESREKESPINSLQHIVGALGAQIMEMIMLDKTIAFYGHSMGALIAFEVAHLLHAEGSTCPSHLFVGGWYAPSLPYPHPQELRVSPILFDPSTGTQQIMEEARAFSFLPEAVLNNPTRLRRLLPCIQAGITICKSYICQHNEPLPCNVVAFGGQDDPFISPDLLEKWKLVAFNESAPTQAFRKCIMQGGHFFISSSRQDVLNKITSILQEDSVIVKPSDHRDVPNVIDMQPSPTEISTAMTPIRSAPVIHKAAAYLQYQLKDPRFSNTNLYVMFRTKNVPADVESWRSIFRQLMDRHETLRSTYHVSNDAQYHSGVQARYYNEIAGATDIDILTGYQENEAEEEVFQRTKVPFHLNKEYPARCIVAPTGNRSAVVGLVLHHIATDTTSFNILFRDFAQIMKSNLRKKSLQKPMTTLTYGAFIQYYYSYLQQNQKELREFWRAALPPTIPSINLPFAKPRPPTFCSGGGSLEVNLPKEQVRSLMEYAKAVRTTVYSIMATTYQLLLHIYTKHDDIVIACPFDMRMLAPQFSNVHGLFQHHLPLSASFGNKDQSYQDTIRQYWRKLQDCKKHGIFPIDEIMKMVSYEKHPAMEPIMQHIVVQNDITSMNQMFNGATGKRVRLLRNGYHDFPEDFVLHLFQDTNTKDITCGVRYSKSLFDEEVAQCMVDDYVSLLSTCLKNPKWSLSEIINAVEMTALNFKSDTGSGRDNHQLPNQAVSHKNGKSIQQQTVHGLIDPRPTDVPHLTSNGHSDYPTVNGRSDRVPGRDELQLLHSDLLRKLQNGTIVRKMTSTGRNHKRRLQLMVENQTTANLQWGSNKARQLAVSSISSIQCFTAEGKPSLRLVTELRDFTFMFISNDDMESWRHALCTLVSTASEADSASEDTYL
ncbi:6-deoxyerythronolide-B synthase EryA2, modules 3 and 4-like isoform X2 [Branchiostoma floridae]|uniref:Fatty acid synthase n=1 Tax=Branchiostoma floridae TaxID=7739 RepID=A0A9J7KV38_BRAFL|nr:6-deoxyerythronolide-B synthase EryA2, modules 3 and 4-like isoform X2 [Branchiostoma floridae]